MGDFIGNFIDATHIRKNAFSFDLQMQTLACTIKCKLDF